MGFMAFIKQMFTKGNGTEVKGGNRHSNAGDLTLSCVECGKNFTFEAGEQKFFKMRGLTPPKRCAVCRGKKRRGRR